MENDETEEVITDFKVFHIGPDDSNFQRHLI